MIAYTVPAAVLAMAALFAWLGRRHRRAQVRADLREVRARIRAQSRARIAAEVAAMSYAAITWELIGICQASAAAERTNHPTTTE